MLPGRLPEWRRWREPLAFVATLRQRNADFNVIEQLDPEFSDDGEHDYLLVEKDGNNTQYVARRLAAFAGVPAKDVGFAGLKDRHAVTRQWFSVRRASADGVEWPDFAEPGVTILGQGRHRRKLRRGAHRGNRFRIALRVSGLHSHRASLEQRLEDIDREGVPNYFGPQRFGRDASNLSLLGDLSAGRRLARDKRGLAISVARSFLFNEILSYRVALASWNRVSAGELANLAGSNSVFAVGDAIDAELEPRCRAHDIHPTATLWGDGAPLSSGAAAELERRVVSAYPEIVAALGKNRVEAGSRALRLDVNEFSWQIDDDVAWLDFVLGPGGFATAVIREIAPYQESRNNT